MVYMQHKLRVLHDHIQVFMTDDIQFHLESIVKTKNGFEAKVKDLKYVNGFESVPINDYLKLESRKKQLKKFDVNQMLTLVSLALGNDQYQISQARTENDKVLILLAMAFSAIVIISNFTSSRLVEVFGFTMTGALFYPLTYFIANTITEVYGFKKMRLILFISVALNLLLALNIWFITSIMPAPYCSGCKEFDLVTHEILSLTVASIVSFMLGTYINSYLLARMKTKLSYSLAKRLFLSTIVAIIIDSSLFVILAFGPWKGFSSIRLILEIIAEKFCYEILLLYPTILFCRYIKALSKTDIYDFATNFSLFRLFDTAYSSQHNAWHAVKNKA